VSAQRHHPPYKAAGAVLLVVVAITGFLLVRQFRGQFTPTAQLTVVASRAGLVVDPGSKVTFNGVEIGKVVGVDGDGRSARLSLDIKPRYLPLLPANVLTDIKASTVFGNKYVSFSSPEQPDDQRLSDRDVVHATSVTTEFNTLFETVTAIAEKVDPVKLNQTLTATAEALTGLGDRFGGSLMNGNRILGELNPRMPQIRLDTAGFADLTAVYADASPDLWAALENGVRTAGTLNSRRADVDAALMAAIGFSDAATDPLERAGPYFVGVASDLLPTAKLLDDYRGMIFCTLRNFHDVGPQIQRALGGNNGYSLAANGALTGAGNPYVYPDNLPRINAKGGPEGRPGCWQQVTKDLWPMPYLVMDTGYSIAPYNHIEIGQPIAIDYVWGRQIGELTINP
jgi:phospholipid/cholesterol/gamma-HCH transport system substrate-binding protein